PGPGRHRFDAAPADTRAQHAHVRGGPHQCIARRGAPASIFRLPDVHLRAVTKPGVRRRADNRSMKLIGIVGGIGPESTIEIGRLFISTYRERRPDGGYPPVVINSIDLARVLKLVGSNDLAGLAAYMLEEVRRLARAGATHGLLSSNTPHIVFAEIRRASPIPLISIVEPACRAAVDTKRKRVGLFGARRPSPAGSGRR